jgi:predicted ATP-grasp superfamily ATP-dependent carboligase
VYRDRYDDQGPDPAVDEEDGSGDLLGSDVRTPAIVLGKGVTAIGVMRSLARKGIDVFTVAPLGDLATRSRYFKPTTARCGATFSNQWTRDDYAVLDRVDLTRAVLIPCSDVTAEWVARMPNSLKSRFYSSCPSIDCINVIQDKRAFAGLCANLKSPHPQCFPMEDDADLAKAPIESRSELFFKPSNSRQFLAKYKCKAMHIESRDQAQTLWRKFQSHQIRVLIQEFIPGPADRHFFADGYRDRDGVIRAKHSRQRLRAFPADFGNSSYCKQIPDEYIGSAWKTLEDLLAHIDYQGIFSAEFKYDERDRTYKILEINSRAWVYVEFASWCGFNVCWLSYLDALNLPLPELTANRTHAACVDLYRDYRSIRSHPSTDRPRRTALLSQWIASRKPLFCWDDPLPAITWFLRTISGRFA